jgi:hypothetical protein
MSIKVNIFYPELKRTVGNQDSIQVAGHTVGECISDLVKQYPQAQKLLFDPQGRLLKQIYVFVNSESLMKVPFNQPVTEKDFLMIAVLVTGG